MDAKERQLIEQLITEIESWRDDKNQGYDEALLLLYEIQSDLEALLQSVRSVSEDELAEELAEAIKAYRAETTRLKSIGLNQYGEIVGQSMRSVTPQEPAHGTRLGLSALREEDRDGEHLAASHRAATDHDADNSDESTHRNDHHVAAADNRQGRRIATPPEAHSDDVEGESAPFLPGRNPRTYTFLQAFALAERNTELAAEVERLRADLVATAQARDDWRKLYEMSQPDAILKGTVQSRGEPG